MSAQILPMLPEPLRFQQADTLSVWLFIAATIHAIILLGVRFAEPEPEKVSKAIEVTIVNSATRKAPRDAKYLAQENQIGAGLEKRDPRPAEQKIPSPGELQKQSGSNQQKSEIKSQAQHRLITQNKAPETVESAEEKPDDATTEAELSMEALERQIAQLGERIKYLEANSEKTNIKFVDSISAHKYVAAEYVRDWEHKVERIGNLNYPDVAKQKDFSGTLSMDVGIKADGGIYNIEIVKSSGIKALDESAKQIVRISAPFKPLPQVILNELDVLVIRRVWSFSDETQLTTY